MNFSSILICFCKQQLRLTKLNHVICFNQWQLVLVKTNEDRTTSRKGLLVWNTLRTHVRSIESFPAFKRDLKQYFSVQYSDWCLLINIRNYEYAKRMKFLFTVLGVALTTFKQLKNLYKNSEKIEIHYYDHFRTSWNV